MFSKILLVAAMSIGAAACVGDVDSGTPENPENPNPNPNGNTEKAAAAKKEYEDKVYPIVEAKCGGCHKGTLPTFIGTTKDNSYAAVTGFTSVIGSWTPDSAGISNIPVRTAHNGITYDAAQRTTINGWLALEAEARAGGGGGGGGGSGSGGETPGQASARLLKEFQKCMSLTAFNTLQVAQRMANTGSDGGQCGECHNGGTAGFIASVNSTTVFNALKNPTNDAAIGTFWLAQYYTPQVLTAPYQVIFNEAAFLRAGGGKYPFQNHPQFQLNGAGFTAVKNYLTEVKKGLDASGNCTTPPAT